MPKSSKAKKRLAINPTEAEVVRHIFALYLAGLGAKAITERLTKEGYDYRGKPWSKNRVLDILADEAYVGRYYFNRKDKKTGRLKPKDEWVTIPVEPIIDEITWQKAQAIRGINQPQGQGYNPATAGAKTLLTGIAKCGLCGSSMTMESARGGKYVYYNCSGFIRQGRATCQGQRIPAAKLEEAVLDHLANKLFSRRRVKAILKGIVGELKHRDQRLEERRRSLRRQLEVVADKLNRQFEAIEKGVIDLTDVGERIRELKARRKELQQTLEEIKPSSPIPVRIYTDESIESFQATVRELFLSGHDRMLTKRYLKLFLEKIVVKLPRVELVGKSEIILAILENQKAVRTGGVLTAVGSWLPRPDSNQRHGG